MTDWVTISALATAGGTLVLATATFASVRSANRAARVAEQALMTNLRPLLTTSRLEDPGEKVGFADDHYMRIPGGGAGADVTDDAIYLAISLRNAGSGLALLHGWVFHPERNFSPEHPNPEEFRRLTRDLYIAPGDLGFWQGAFRDANDPQFAVARAAIEARQPISHRHPVRRPGGRAAHDQPFRSHPPGRRQLDGRGRPPLERRPLRPPLIARLRRRPCGPPRPATARSRAGPVPGSSQ